MPDEQTNQAAGGQANSQSSSSAASQSTSAGASDQGNSSNGQGSSQQQANSQRQAPARPAYVPEAHWDAQGGKIKDEAAYTQFVNDHVAFKAAEDSRRLTLPQKAEDLPLALPADFVVPQGIEFKFNEADPLLSKGREFALKHGLTKEGWTELVGLYAGGQVSSKAQLDTARAAEIGKLGATGTARVSAVQTWLGAQLGEDAAKHMATMLVTAGHVEGFEKLIRNFTTQGSGTFSQHHRDTPVENGKIEGYENMSFEQRRFAQDQQKRATAR